jgi:hypothetical protein
MSLSTVSQRPSRQTSVAGLYRCECGDCDSVFNRRHLSICRGRGCYKLLNLGCVMRTWKCRAGCIADETEESTFTDSVNGRTDVALEPTMAPKMR